MQRDTGYVWSGQIKTSISHKSTLRADLWLRHALRSHCSIYVTNASRRIRREGGRGTVCPDGPGTNSHFQVVNGAQHEINYLTIRGVPCHMVDLKQESWDTDDRGMQRAGPQSSHDGLHTPGACGFFVISAFTQNSSFTLWKVFFPPLTRSTFLISHNEGWRDGGHVTVPNGGFKQPDSPK